jgi:hypothetical protein
VTIDNVVSTLKDNAGKTIEATIAGKSKIALKVDLTPRQRQVLVAGGLLNYIRSTTTTTTATTTTQQRS